MPLPSPSGARHRTKQEFVYRALRDAITACELAPGERLVIDDLARRLGVSTIPVREALQLLQSEALVTTVPHVGATVAPITRESIIDVFTIMEGLALGAARLVVERADEEAIASLTATVQSMDTALAGHDLERWADLNTTFHLGLAAVPGLPMLEEMTERVLNRWGRVRRFYFRGVLVHRMDQAQREHHAMIAALRVRDVAALEMWSRQHNQNALRAYLSYLDSHLSDAPGQA